MTFCRIQGVSTAVPSRVVPNAAFFPLLGGEASAARVFSTVGIQERRWAPKGTTALDLCISAAESLLLEVGNVRGAISAVVFVTQTPDFPGPASACIAQARLELPRTCLAFDVNQGCAGFLYGLAVAKGLILGGMAQRVLLLVGDTSSQTCHPEDASTVPLFGDSGTACLVEASRSEGIGTFHFETDGTGWDALTTPVGGSRFPTVVDFQSRADEFLKQKVAHPGHFNMDGGRVFSYCMEHVPGLVESVLTANACSRDQLDFILFHQANLMMMEAIRRKARLPKEGFLQSLDRFGNTSVASIPVTMTASRACLVSGGTALLAGFGIGFSLGGTIVRLDSDVVLPPLVEVSS